MTDSSWICTPESIRLRVDAILQARKDYEWAHHLEDILHRDVLDAIANGRAEDPATCAREAIKSCDIQFPRFKA